MPTMTPSITPTQMPTKIPTQVPSASQVTIDIISTIAGTGAGSYSGDNGAATSAAIYGPFGVTVDSSGTSAQYFICSHGNYCSLVYKVMFTSVSIMVVVSGR